MQQTPSGIRWTIEEINRLPENDRLAQIQDEAGHFQAAPELVVEVLSPGKTNEERDCSAKLKLYSTQNVREYWIVDRPNQRIEVYRRENAQLVLVAAL